MRSNDTPVISHGFSMAIKSNTVGDTSQRAALWGGFMNFEPPVIQNGTRKENKKKKYAIVTIKLLLNRDIILQTGHGSLSLIELAG